MALERRVMRCAKPLLRDRIVILLASVGARYRHAEAHHRVGRVNRRAADVRVHPGVVTIYSS